MDKYIKEKVDGKIIVDETTGEISEMYINKKVSIDEFIMVFLHSIPEMNSLTGNEIKLLMEIWRYSTFNKHICDDGNMFYNSKMFRSFCKDDGLDLAEGNVAKYICSLSKKNFIIKISRGIYMLNPNYFYKGTLNDRMKAIINIQYVDGFKVTTFDPVK